MEAGLDPDQGLRRVQARREGPVKLVQAAQRMVQDRLIVPAIKGEVTRALAALELLNDVPMVPPDTRQAHRPFRATRKGSLSAGPLTAHENGRPGPYPTGRPRSHARSASE
ncbi:hypothetical protein [Croceicoccus sp. BE223]|uniref:hypothetical protein n=1 Tax=Croceicoccus sp. BE223 TaxID=2817716 RepID=UPI0028551C8D|nr:hypothetical protein [Croceicoccus sp. BE223]MDR7103498.1 hypothetical protein [Croceicoccus sp. BE223]